MLAAEIQTCGLKITDEKSFVSLWRDERGRQSRPSGEIFASLFQRQSLIHHLLDLDSFDVRNLQESEHSELIEDRYLRMRYLELAGSTVIILLMKCM